MSTRRFKPVPSHSSYSRTCQLSHTCACNTYLTLNLYELKLNGKTKQKRRGINTQPLVFLLHLTIPFLSLHSVSHSFSHSSNSFQRRRRTAGGRRRRRRLLRPKTHQNLNFLHQNLLFFRGGYESGP
jgi:hypothetical protein